MKQKQRGKEQGHREECRKQWSEDLKLKYVDFLSGKQGHSSLFFVFGNFAKWPRTSPSKVVISVRSDILWLWLFDVLREDFQRLTPNHEEADKRIILSSTPGMLLSAATFRVTDVFCRDTDVLVLLLANTKHLWTKTFRCFLELLEKKSRCRGRRGHHC